MEAQTFGQSPMRRRTVADRPRSRRPVGKLGAKRLTAPEVPPSAAAVTPCSYATASSEAEADDAPQERAPQDVARQENPAARSASPVNPADERKVLAALPTVYFQQQLAETKHSDSWLDEQLISTALPEAATLAPKARASRAAHRREGDVGLLSHVQRGLQALMDGEAYVQQRTEQMSSRPGPSAESLVDKGLDAFSSISRAAVGVATTLDSAFENLLEGWSLPIERAMGRRLPVAAAVESPSDSPVGSPGAASGQSRHSSVGVAGVQGLLPRVLNPQESVDYLAELWGSRKALSGIMGPKAPSTPPAQRQKQSARGEGASGSGAEAPAEVSQGVAGGEAPPQQGDVAQVPASNRGAPLAPTDDWDASWEDASDRDGNLSADVAQPDVQQRELLAAELAAMRTQQAEFLHLRTQLERMQGDLVQAASRCSALSEENTVLRRQRPPCSPQPAMSPNSRTSSGRQHGRQQEDPFTEQVRSQLEMLLAEKAALAQENERLSHENCGLQQLLQYSVQAAGLDGVDGGCGELGQDLGDGQDALSDWSSVEGAAIAAGEVPCPDSDFEAFYAIRERTQTEFCSQAVTTRSVPELI